jgi:hypothetical protein
LQLGLWRAFYRLKQLTVRGSGPHRQVYASVNPEGPFGNLERFGRDDVYRVISEIGRRQLGRAPALGAASGGGLVVPAGQSPMGLGPAMLERPTLPGRGETVPIGIGGGTVFGAQGRGASNVIIRGLGTYPEITEKLAGQGLTGPSLTAAMMQSMKTGTAPPGVSPAALQDVRRLSALMFGTEMARSRVTGATTPLTMIGMERGALTTPGAFGVSGAERPLGGGLYPPSQVGFVGAQRRSEARLTEGREFRPGTGIHGASEENINRTVQLVATVTQEMYFDNLEHFRLKVIELLEMFERRLAG